MSLIQRVAGIRTAVATHRVFSTTSMRRSHTTSASIRRSHLLQKQALLTAERFPRMQGGRQYEACHGHPLL